MFLKSPHIPIFLKEDSSGCISKRTPISVIAHANSKGNLLKGLKAKREIQLTQIDQQTAKNMVETTGGKESLSLKVSVVIKLLLLFSH